MTETFFQSITLADRDRVVPRDSAACHFFYNGIKTIVPALTFEEVRASLLHQMAAHMSACTLKHEIS
jgi:hypothetical protein